MDKIKVLHRKLSLGEELENQRKKIQAEEHRKTYTVSVKISNGHYMFYRKKKA